MAISLAHDGTARAKLCAGYVRLEVFVSDAEFEIVTESQAADGEAAGRSASAILTRVAEQMLVRERELSIHA